MIRPTLLAVALICTACSSNVPLNYQPSQNVFRSGPAAISTVDSVDQRKEQPNRLATIMGGFGNPLKILNTERPVKDEVASVFAKGLEARGLRQLDGRGPLRLDLVVRKFDADMIMGSTARIDLTMTLVDVASGRPIYTESVNDQKSDFHFFATGVLANVDEFRQLAESLLNTTVDRMLDRPEFRAAIAAAFANSTPPSVRPVT